MTVTRPAAADTLWEALIATGVRDDPVAGTGAIVVCGAAGGAGVSTVAAALALAIASAGRPVTLAELDFERGGLGVAQGLPPGRTLDDLAAVADDLRPDHVRAVTVESAPGLRLLLAPGRLGADRDWTGPRVHALLSRLADLGEVVVDAGGLRGDAGVQLCRDARWLTLVATPSLAAAERTRSVAAAIRAHQPQARIAVVLNAGVGRDHLSERAFARACGEPVHVALPRAERPAVDVVSGRPITRRRCRFRDRIDLLMNAVLA